MGYVKRSRSSWFVTLKNLPKLRTRARHDVLRTWYAALALFALTAGAVAAVVLYTNRAGY